MTKRIKVVVAILVATCLSSCSLPKDAGLGDEVKVVDGFYKGCKGTVSDTFSWVTPCQKRYTLRPASCPKSDDRYVIVSACDIEVLSEQ